jgi:hypothetical protein
MLTYAVVGPVTGALFYVAISAAAAPLGLKTNLFLAPALFEALSATAGLAIWQIAVSAPLSVMPALATGWLTWRRIEQDGACPWWRSCLYGALTSGPPGALFLWVSRLAAPAELTPIIPHPLTGGALIGLIGFLGTWPSWRIAVGRGR